MHFKFLPCFLFFSIGIVQLNAQSVCEEWTAIADTLKTRHYAYKPLDNNTSKEVHKLLLRGYQDQGAHFLKEDYTLFESDALKLDDYLLSQDCSFLERYITTAKKRIEETDALLAAFEEQPFSYEVPDTISLSAESRALGFATTEAKKEHWRQVIKYRTINSYLKNDTLQEADTAAFTAKEQGLRKEVINQLRCKIGESVTSDGGMEGVIKRILFQAFLNYQDPHTRYFEASAKAVYDDGLAKTSYATGINTKKNSEGYIEVTSVVPGSSAYKTRKILAGDIVKAVTIQDEYIDVTCFSNRDFEQRLIPAHIDTVIYHISRDGGITEDVEVRKSKIDIEQNSLTGYIIKKGALRLGIIRIPSFYVDEYSIYGLGMANDVSRELYKLQAEGIDGLIIDVRDNGGGSMKEAIDLTGLFIDNGPVAITSDKKTDPVTYRDQNRGVVFDKEIAVLINEYSASASELFAAAIQDYNRGIVVGARTYGKSTAQVSFPLFKSDSTNYMKLTTDVFFRVTGRSHQGEGVYPDIALPSLYEGLAKKEADRAYPIANHTIVAKVDHEPLPLSKMKTLKQKSAARVAKDTAFKTIVDANKLWLKDYQTVDKIQLSIGSVSKYLAKRKALSKVIRQAQGNATDTLEIVNTENNEILYSLDDDANALNERILKAMKNDPVIVETVHILNDLITSEE